MRIFFTLSVLLLLSLAGLAQSGQPQVSAIKFYPNPAVSYITFEFPSNYEKGYSFEVYNFLGKKVFEQKNINPKTTIDLSQYYRGIYIFQLRDKAGRIVESGRFQVNK
ncbi:MAG: T9SS type A sorting domain-containing protein [Bacteroidetes bacterium]|nr:T9SS type A sorting domain-containing protein [Bacteroidota bacterium]